MRTLREIFSALRSWDIWWTFAVDDVVSRYRRTIFGPIWIILAQAAFIGGLFVLHGTIYGDSRSISSRDLLLYFAVSLPLWNMVAANIIEGALAFLRAKSFIEAYPLPLPIHIIRSVVASLVTFAHVILVYVIAALALHAPFGIAAIAAVPGLCLVILFGFGCSLGLAPLGTRFRDISPALATVMSLLFVLTPVFWIPAPGQSASIFVQLNPFYHMLEVAREPLLNHWPTWKDWVAAILTTIASLGFGTVVYATQRASIIYWL